MDSRILLDKVNDSYRKSMNELIKLRNEMEEYNYKLAKLDISAKEYIQIQKDIKPLETEIIIQKAFVDGVHNTREILMEEMFSSQ